MNAIHDSKDTRAATLAIEYLPIDKLKPNPKNPKRHGKKQIDILAASMREHGNNCPILVDENLVILAGHGRLAACRQEKLRDIPVIRLAGLSDARKLSFMLADNRISEMSDWDRNALAIVIEEIELADISIELTGFSTAEADILVLDSRGSNGDRDEPLPKLSDDYVPVTRQGDLWFLDEHRLVCGDATKTETCQALLGDERVQMVFTDPPYNLPARSISTTNRRNFVMAAGELSVEGFQDFLRGHMKAMRPFLVDGAILYECIDWRHLADLQLAANGLFETRNVCVWVKDRAGMGTFYRSQHEFVVVLKHGTGAHINNFELGQHGRFRSNVWHYPAGRNDDDIDMIPDHPTPKPVQMVADAIRDCSRRGGIVLDAFGGSGTTLIAAWRTGRRARLIELDPVYCDLAILRWQKLTGAKAIHASVNCTFGELQTARTAISHEAQAAGRNAHV